MRRSSITRLPTHTRYVAKRAAGPELRRNTKTRELKHALKLKELVCVLMLARIRKIRPAAAGRHAGIGPRGAGEYPLQDISPLRKAILLDLLKL